jgi:hypothetical protein
MTSPDSVDFDPTVRTEEEPSPASDAEGLTEQEAEAYASEVIATVQETSRPVPSHEAEAVAALSEAIQEQLDGSARFANDAEFQAAKDGLANEVYGNSGPERIVNGQQEVSDAEFAAAKRQLEQEVYSQRGGVVAAEEIPAPLTETSSDTLATRMINNTDAAIRSVLPPAVGNLADRAQVAIEKGWSSLKGKLSGMWKRTDAPAPIAQTQPVVTPRTESAPASAPVSARATEVPRQQQNRETPAPDGVSAALDRMYKEMSPEARARMDASRAETERILAQKSPEMLDLESQIEELEQRMAKKSGGTTYQRHDYGIQGAHYTRKAGTAARSERFMDDAIINQGNAAEKEQQELAALRNRLFAEGLKQGKKNSDALAAMRKQK